MRHKILGFLVVVCGLILGPIAFAQGNLLNNSLFDKANNLLGNLGNLSGQQSQTGLSVKDISSGLTEAIWVGAQKVIGQLGATDGFNADERVHIPLPGQLRKVNDLLGRVGMSKYGDQLETRLNRSAEHAIPVAKDVLWETIQGMSWDDARGILDGPDDAATQFFRREASGTLTEQFRPIVQDSLAEAGAIRAYDRMLGKYKDLPLVPDVSSDLTEHVVKLALDGLFLYLGEQEAAIRRDPAARSTELLRKVFAN